MPRFMVTMVLLTVSVQSALAAAQATPVNVDDLDWIVGTWEGVGPLEHDGETRATSIFTDPVEGVLSWTFRWHTPENGHVHFAFTVIETTAGGVVSRGIHHGRDFRTFEPEAWRMRLEEAGDRWVRFVCVERCGGRTLTLELTGDGRLLEQYQPPDASAPLSVFEYRRVR